MQTDLNVSHVNASDVDQDDDGSLFGSPPPSPALSGRGRSPSRSPLSLPSGVGSAQNVGTLALPGSHLVAELPVVLPPALLPAPCVTAVQPPRAASQGARVSRPPSVASQAARSSSIPSATTAREPAPRKRRSRAKASSASTSASSTPRPTPPPIPLPSPGTQPPPNFLRNQEALLGLAGVVGGVKPAQLQQTRGATSRNPIDVDDLPEVPLSHAPPPREPPSLSRNPRPPPVDPSQLPTPPTRDVIQSLLRQRNVVPVLDGLLRLLTHPVPPMSRSPYTAASSWQRRPPNAPPPLKRRRLNSVPAGAADWDVPYPFQKGHGPRNYAETWARERGRNLLVDLVRLLQGAVQKAALKSYISKQRQRPETMPSGVAPWQNTSSPSSLLPEVLAAGVTATTGEPIGVETWQQSSPGLTLPEEQQEVPSAESFDQLLESILTATGSVPPAPATGNQAGSSTDAFPSTAASSTHIDDWLALLNAFPPGAPDDVSADLDSIFDSIFAGTSSSIPGTSGDTSDFMIDPAMLSSVPRPVPSVVTQGSSEDAVLDSTSGCSSQAMTPRTNTATGSNPARPATPMLVGSPLASASSLAADPPTPDWNWEVADADTGQDVTAEPEVATTNTVEQDGLSSLGIQSEHNELSRPDPKGKGKERAHDVSDLQTHPSNKLSILPAEVARQVAAPSENLAHVAETQHPSRPQPFQQVPQSHLHAPAPINPTTTVNLLVQSCSIPPRPASQPHPHPYAYASGSPSTYSLLSTMYPSAPQTSTASPALSPQISGQRQPLFPPQFVPSAASYSALSPPSYAYPVPLTPSSSTSLAQTPRPPPARINRANVLARARAVRSALAAEARRAKVELWEATLEHAVLVNLSKDEGAGQSS